MPDLSIEITGMAELQKVLSSLSAQVKPQLQKGLMKTALQIVNKAKKGCPVDSGNLRSSIAAHKSGTDGAIVTAGGTAGTGAGQLLDVQYAVYVEYGTRFMAPEPFFRPAIDQCMPNLIQNITDALTVEQAGALSGVHFKTDLGLGAVAGYGADLGGGEDYFGE